MEKEINFTSSELTEKFNVKIVYIKVVCKKCFNSWGVTVRDGKVLPRDLVCETCAGNEMLKNITE